MLKKLVFTFQKNLTYFCYGVLKTACETIDVVEIMRVMKEMDPGNSEIEINIIEVTRGIVIVNLVV